MAWTIVDKETARALSGMSFEDLRDEWSDMVESLICDYMGYNYVGETEEIVDEPHDGTGTSILFVDKPPIISVNEIKIHSTTLSARAYKVYSHYVKRVQQQSSKLAESLGKGKASVFPEGEQNIHITYTSGMVNAPAKVKLAAAQMLAEVVRFQKRGGAQGSVKYIPVEQRDGDGPTAQERHGLSGVLQMIMRETIGRRVIRIR